MRRCFFWLPFLVICFACQSNDSRPAESSREERSVPARSRDLDPAIVAFGDSLTAGFGLRQEQSYPAQLQALLDDAGHPYRVINAGINGETSAQGLSRVPSIIDQNPHLVILELGANDGLRGIPISSIQQNLETIIKRLKARSIPVVLAGMRLPPNYGLDYAEQFRQMYLDLAKKYDLTLIPFFLDQVAGHPELNLEDGIHPTAEGYRIVTRAVFEAIKPLL
ncbi:MAG: arylesterase [Acidobacteria bacterium]|nr:arylesterase [Acidobacteriota bacterium]